MRRSWGFVASAFLIVASGVALAWSFLDPAGREALVLSGFLVLVTQIPLHFLLEGWRSSTDRFMGSVLVGSGSRVLLLVLSIVFVVVPGRAAPAPFLLGLGVFLVAVLLTESIFQQRSVRASGRAAQA